MTLCLPIQRRMVLHTHKKTSNCEKQKYDEKTFPDILKGNEKAVQKFFFRSLFAHLSFN